MPQTINTHWGRSVFIALFVTIVLAALVFGWFRTENLWATWFVGVFFSVCAGLFMYSTIHDWLKDRRLHHLLKEREAIDPDTFGARYFKDLSRGPEIAATVRRLLDEHLNRELGGLRPDDPLDCLQDWIDPLFVDELARKLDFPPPADWTEYCKFLEPMRTIRDLVQAVARKVSELPRANGTRIST